MLTNPRFVTRFFAALLPVVFAIAAFSQTAWDKFPGNPVLFNGFPGQFDETVAGATTVLVQDDVYKMWYEGNRGFGYATSMDGIAWNKYSGNPILEPGPPGSWDALTINQASVVALGDSFHMWYSGIDIMDENRIGHATSPDGMVWTKDPNNPVLDLAPPGNWDDQEVIHPCVMYDEGVFKMWYNGHDGITQRILYATSPDGVNWTRFTSRPMLEPGTAGRWDDTELGPLTVLRANDGYHMWYTGWNQASEYRIGYATSPDGTDWTKDEIHNPVLMPGQEGDWDDWAVALPSVLLIDSVLTMWYGGTRGTIFLTGVATSISDLVPTLLRAYTATCVGSGVQIKWELAKADAKADFRVLRSQSRLDELIKLGGETVADGRYFSYTDADVRPGTTYRYAVDAIDGDGRRRLFETGAITTPILSTALDPIYPNPFNPQTTIRYTVAEPGQVTVGVYDVAGRLVKLLVDDVSGSGRHTTSWDGRNAEGAPVASGVYFIRLASGKQTQTRKAVMTK